MIPYLNLSSYEHNQKVLAVDMKCGSSGKMYRKLTLQRKKKL